MPKLVTVSRDALLWNSNEVLKQGMKLAKPCHRCAFSNFSSSVQDCNSEQVIGTFEDAFEAVAEGIFELPPGLTAKVLATEAEVLRSSLAKEISNLEVSQHGKFASLLLWRLKQHRLDSLTALYGAWVQWQQNRPQGAKCSTLPSKDVSAWSWSEDLIEDLEEASKAFEERHEELRADLKLRHIGHFRPGGGHFQVAIKPAGPQVKLGFTLDSHRAIWQSGHSWKTLEAVLQHVRSIAAAVGGIEDSVELLLPETEGQDIVEQ